MPAIAWEARAGLLERAGASCQCAGCLEIEPGAMRELHWHPHADEWQYYLEGAAEMGVQLVIVHLGVVR